MSKRLILNAARLQMFNDGGAATAAGTEGDSTTQETTSQPIKYESKRKSRINSGKKTGELSDVVYGKQTSAESAAGDTEGSNSAAESKADVTTTSNTLEDKRAAFEELIKGDYKDEFTQRTQQIIDRRFKETKNLEARLNQAQPILDMLMSKYKTDDIGKLAKAIETDDAYWEEAAEEAGLTVEQYRQVQKLERENKELRLRQQQAQGQQQMNAQLNEWYRQAEAVKAIYPNFDLKTESQNREFLSLLKAGIPVQKAYETMHLDELVNGAATVAARQAEQRTVSSIKNRAARPAENGTSSQSTATIKSDVRSLTKADREEIARRAARGERITF